MKPISSPRGVQQYCYITPEVIRFCGTVKRGAGV